MVTVLASTCNVVRRNSEHTVTRARHAKMERCTGAPKQILIFFICPPNVMAEGRKLATVLSLDV
jgi:hypothetical protein